MTVSLFIILVFEALFYKYGDKKRITSQPLKEIERETYSDEYHLVNSIFELSDKTKQIAVIFRFYFKVIIKPDKMV